ncbi:hypothetical protein TNCV_4442521 [Trichonephila clavipes]|nr:hypothetical protein TNCV_4442521 [Trichonephila clavipes]
MPVTRMGFFHPTNVWTSILSHIRFSVALTLEKSSGFDSSKYDIEQIWLWNGNTAFDILNIYLQIKHKGALRHLVFLVYVRHEGAHTRSKKPEFCAVSPDQHEPYADVKYSDMECRSGMNENKWECRIPSTYSWAINVSCNTRRMECGYYQLLLEGRELCRL